MRKQRFIWLTAALAVCLASGVAWLAWTFNDPTPTYQGKPLTYWLEGYGPGNYNLAHPTGPPRPTREQADAAIRQMGTNALPALLRMLKQESALKRKILMLVQRQHYLKIPYEPGNRNFLALEGFRALGSGANSAIPRLIAIFEKDPTPFPQQAVPQILSQIGPPAAQAVPALVRGLNHTNVIVRNNSAYALGQIHSQPGRVVPALTTRLADAESIVRMQAALALGKFGAEAESAVPALNGLLRKEPPKPTAVSSAYFSNFGTVIVNWAEWPKNVPTNSTATLILGGSVDVAGTVTEALEAISRGTTQRDYGEMGQ